MKLSRNFGLHEFLRSDTAKRLEIENYPDNESHFANLHALALGMEQVRMHLGGLPITITSGYRCDELNRAVGGVTNSAHALGIAADFTVKNLTAREVALEVAASRLAFDQLILETSREVCHISFDSRLRGEVKTQKGGPGSPVVWGIK